MSTTVTTGPTGFTHGFTAHPTSGKRVPDRAGLPSAAASRNFRRQVTLGIFDGEMAGDGPQIIRFQVISSGKLTLLWKITMFNGKINYKWTIDSIAMLNGKPGQPDTKPQILEYTGPSVQRSRVDFAGKNTGRVERPLLQ